MTSQPKRAAGGPLKWVLMGALLINTVLLSETLAQAENKLRKDPTYSIHNYKHPNKATAARAWESEIVLGRQERDRRQVRIGDYKRPATAEPGSSRWVIRSRRNQNTKPELLSGYNYKTPQPSGTATKRVARKSVKPVETVPVDEMPTGNE